jgi:hypothetical protein
MSATISCIFCTMYGTALLCSRIIPQERCSCLHSLIA